LAVVAIASIVALQVSGDAVIRIGSTGFFPGRVAACQEEDSRISVQQ
jgi:hypothetical protein